MAASLDGSGWEVTDTGKANFVATAGREASTGDLAWANSGPVVNQYGSADAALNHIATNLQAESQQFVTAADAMGIKGFDLPKANALRDQYLGTSGDYGQDKKDNARSFVGAKLQGLLSDQTAKDQEDKVNAKTNPTVSDANRGSAANIIKQMYGRDATQDEIEYFAKELAGGTSAYELGQFLTQTPEYQKKTAAAENARVKEEATAARGELNLSLNTQREEAYKKALPGIMSQYMKAGKLSSSGVDSAVAQAQAQLLQQQQQYMAGLQYEDSVRQQGYSRQDFLNQGQQGYQNYLRNSEPAYQQQFNLQGFGNYAQYQSPWDSMNRQYQLSDARTQRSNELQDYYTQQADYNQQMSQQRKMQREGALYGLLGSAIGGGMSGLTMGLMSPKKAGI